MENFFIRFFGPVFSIFIVIIFTVPELNGQKLKPKNVIIHSSYKEKSIRVKTVHHKFDLQPLIYLQEPYLPEFQFLDFELPEAFPQNREISWLSRNLGFLSEIFLGDIGILEKGLVQYRKGNLDLAKITLIQLIHSPTQISDVANLYLGWIEYKRNHWDLSYRYTSKILNSKNASISQEAHFLISLLKIRQRNYKEHIKIMQQYEKRIKPESWGFRLPFYYLVSLIKLEKWDIANQLISQINQTGLSHAKQFYKIKEAIAIVSYNQQKYSISLNNYFQANKLNPLLSYQYQIFRNIAWIQYFTGEYQQSIDLIDVNARSPYKEFSEELKYLKIICLLNMNKRNLLKPVLNQLKKESPFYSYASFKIKSFYKNPEKYKNLIEQQSFQAFDSPGMIFHITSLDGNHAFKKNRFKKAIEQYQKALSLDETNINANKTQFNLALSLLKTGRFEKANRILLTIKNSKQADSFRLLPYHILYSFFKLNQGDKYLKLERSINYERYSKPVRSDIHFMTGNIHLNNENHNKAIRDFLWVWHAERNIKALELSALAYYQQSQFQKTIKIANQDRKHTSRALFHFKIQSLLALSKPGQALKIIENHPLNDEQSIEIYLEVLLANQKYKRIITHISALQKGSFDSNKRLFFYLYLGDAYFNLKKYSKSKNQLYRALNLSKDKNIRSLILYNIILSTYHYGDFATFKKEANQILKNRVLTDEIRYSLTQILVDYYSQNQQVALADRTLANYIKNYSYFSSRAHNKRIRLLHLSRAYNKCYSLSQLKKGKESDFSRRDRVIMAGYCGNKSKRSADVAKLINSEFEQDMKDYRKNELNYLLAQAYTKTKKYKRSIRLIKKLDIIELDIHTRHEIKLLQSVNLLNTSRPNQAEAELGDLNQYRKSKRYIDALHIKGEISIKAKADHKAIRTFLRIHYLPQTPIIVKQEALLRIAEFYYQQHNLDKANEYLKKLNHGVVKKNRKTQSRFNQLKKKLNS